MSTVETLVWAKRKSLTGTIKTIPPPIPLPQSLFLILSEVKTRNVHGAVVECRTRDPEVPSSNSGLHKRKISPSSNENNIKTSPCAPEFNT